MNIDTNQISQVLGLITGELEKGVSAAKPLALEYLRQYCAREMLYGVFYCILALMFSAVFTIGAVKLARSVGDADDDTRGFLYGVATLFMFCAVLAFWCGSDAGVTHIGYALAPLPSMLGK